MMKKIFLFAFFLLLALSGYAEKTYVLCVGIADYKYINDLKNTENDAHSVSRLYINHTQFVKTLVGPLATHDNVLSTLRTYFSQATEDDNVVFFFSGHGTRGGLCVYDSKQKDKLITYEELQQVIRGCKARNKQIFIDACFAGGLRNKKKPASIKQQPISQSILTDTEGIMLFLSSRTNEPSQENRWSDNGFFTQYLVMGMKGAADIDNDQIITAHEIFKYVSEKVSERTQKKQNPVMWGKFNDDMHIMNWNTKQ